MALWFAIFLMVAGAGAGWLAGYMHNPTGPGRYATPELHSGHWHPPTMQGVGPQQRVTWELSFGHPICVGSNHAPVRCTIGPGMAHVDECVCGSTRSGVFGVWSS